MSTQNSINAIPASSAKSKKVLGGYNLSKTHHSPSCHWNVKMSSYDSTHDFTSLVKNHKANPFLNPITNITQCSQPRILHHLSSQVNPYHPPIAVFLDPRPLLISSSPTELIQHPDSGTISPPSAL